MNAHINVTREVEGTVVHFNLGLEAYGNASPLFIGKLLDDVVKGLPGKEPQFADLGGVIGMPPGARYEIGGPVQASQKR